MGSLKKAEIVDSERGHGGGWIIVRKASSISLNDIFQALEDSLLPKPSKLSDDKNCLIMQTLCTTMQEFLLEADILLTKKLSRISIQSLIDKIALDPK